MQFQHLIRQIRFCITSKDENMPKDNNSQDHIRYDILVQEALRGVVRKVLSEVEKTGLPGEHHFFISFVTKAPGVRISETLLNQYEKEMTIVIQNQYWDFKVSDTGFQVGLSFNGKNEMLEIPFSALKGFFDPSVQFGLQFDVSAVASDEEKQKEESHQTDNVSDINDKPEKTKKQTKTKKDDVEEIINLSEKTDKKDDESHKVISLDSFRKKD